jgi:hypothetical protein
VARKYPAPEEYTAYIGQFFTLEYYYDENGRLPVKEFIEGLDIRMQAKAFALFKRLADIGKIFDETKFKHVERSDQIFEFKPDPARIFCFFFKGSKVILTNGYIKKRAKADPRQIALSEHHKADYEKRIERGDYYEKDKESL